MLGPGKIKDHESTKGVTIKQPTNPQDEGGQTFTYRTNKTKDFNLFSLSRYIVLYILSSLYKGKIQTNGIILRFSTLLLRVRC